MRRAAAFWLVVLASCNGAPTQPAGAAPTGAAPAGPSSSGAAAAPGEQVDVPIFAEEQLPEAWIAAVEANEPWFRQKQPATSYAEVPSARDLVPEIAWPDSIDIATRDRALQLAAALDPHGGRAHLQAKQTLLELGYPALFAIVGRLRELDYTDTDEAVFGFELNKMLEQLTKGLDARYAPAQAGEKVHPAKAQWNTLTVATWSQAIQQWPDAASFARYLAERTARPQR